MQNSKCKCKMQKQVTVALTDPEGVISVHGVESVSPLYRRDRPRREMHNAEFRIQTPRVVKHGVEGETTGRLCLGDPITVCILHSEFCIIRCQPPIRPRRRGGQCDEDDDGPHESGVDAGVPDEGRCRRRQLPLGTARHPQTREREHVTAGVDHESRQDRVGRPRQPAIHRGDADVVGGASTARPRDDG
jgi:hypothetical protein